MKVLFSIVQAVLFVSAVFSQDETEDIKYIYPDHAFEKGSTELMYGDNVVLRSDEDASSKAIDTLKIGEPVKIIKQGESTSTVNGKQSYWYKVKAKNKVGYVLGGWIALDHKEINGRTYLIIYAERNEELYARTRVLSKDGEFFGREINLNTSTISLELDDSKGLKGVEEMCIIRMHAEACGVVGGQVYLFNNGDRLIEAIRTLHMSEAGLIWFSEDLEFKGADYWEENIAFFSKENGEYMDDSLDWTQAVINKVKITWDGEKFSPNVREIDFDKKPNEEYEIGEH